MLHLEQNHKGYSIRPASKGRFQIIDPYGCKTKEFFRTSEEALEYIDQHPQSVDELIPLIFKQKKTWKYVNPGMGVVRKIEIGDQCVYYVSNRSVYEDFLWDQESFQVEQEIEFPDVPDLDSWRVSIFERESLPDSDRLGWLEVEILNRGFLNKNQAKRFAKRYCQATGIALARNLSTNMVFCDEIFLDEEFADEELEDQVLELQYC